MEDDIQSSSNQHVESDIVVDAIYQAWDAVFHHQMKHQEQSLKYMYKKYVYFWQISRCTRWNTVSNACYCFPNKMILDGEIKDAKMSSFFLSDFQTLIKHWVPVYFLYELLMSLRK